MFNHKNTTGYALVLKKSLRYYIHDLHQDIPQKNDYNNKNNAIDVYERRIYDSLMKIMKK